jgi:hypothetical protein
VVDDMLSQRMEIEAKTIVEKMKISGEAEARIPNSPLTVIQKELYKKGEDLPLALIDDFLVVQRGI